MSFSGRGGALAWRQIASLQQTRKEWLAVSAGIASAATGNGLVHAKSKSSFAPSQDNSAARKEHARFGSVNPSRGYAADAAGGDFVLDFLKEDLIAYETYLEECKKIYYPLGESADDAKVKKFAAEIAAAKKKAKVPTTVERQQQLLGFFKWQAGDSVRDFYNYVTPLMIPENASGAMLALDAVEKEIGKPLLYSDAKAFGDFKKKCEVVAKEYKESVKAKTGLDAGEIMKNLDFYEAKAHLKQVEDDAMDAVAKAKTGPRILDLSQLDDLPKEQMDMLKKMGNLKDSDLKDVDLDLKTIAKMLHKSRASE